MGAGDYLHNHITGEKNPQGMKAQMMSDRHIALEALLTNPEKIFKQPHNAVNGAYHTLDTCL